MTDQEFLDYVEAHSKAPRALFSRYQSTSLNG